MSLYKKILLITLLCFSFIFIQQKLDRVTAEQLDSSPNSGQNSMIKSLFEELVTLGYSRTFADPLYGDKGSYFNAIINSSKTPHNDALAQKIKNGGTTFSPKNSGGVDDWNNGNPLPADTYLGQWTVCNSGNNYCDTGREINNLFKDNNTGLVWSPTQPAAIFFFANNCVYPNGLPGDDGLCNATNDIACNCPSKKTESKTGCEAFDDGNWRLPSQKEAMQAYINGSRGFLQLPNVSRWTATTGSTNSRSALVVTQSTGSTTVSNKDLVLTYYCVRDP
jgi:hypothetical protein